ncbi:hypothetical protein LUZ60_009250 [Juncus effusus]|nr:hypothetical protein LUZ60_009250 [Juncus effusus]
MAGVDVGEMLVSAVVSEVLDKLGSPVWMKIGSIWNLNDDLREVKKNLEMIEAVLSDAERKSITDKPICFWLKELKSAAYDIEDMMCEFETEIPANNQSDGWGASLRKALSATRMWKKRFDLAKQTKDMKEKLSEIAERRSQFGLSTKTGFDTEVVIKERETFSDINIDDTILGRDKEKEELMRMLMQLMVGRTSPLLLLSDLEASVRLLWSNCFIMIRM